LLISLKILQLLRTFENSQRRKSFNQKVAPLCLKSFEFVSLNKTVKVYNHAFIIS